MGIERNSISAVFFIGLVGISLYLIVRKLLVNGWRLNMLELIVVVPIPLTVIIVLSYLFTQIITLAQAMHAIASHAVIPVFFLVGTTLADTNWKKAYRHAFSAVAALIFVHAISEALGTPSFLLANELWNYQKTYIGIPRVTGGFNTQISFGFFLTILAVYFNSSLENTAQKARWLIVSAATLLTVLTFSRVYIAALVFYFAMNFLIGESAKNSWARRLIKVVLGILAVSCIIIFSPDLGLIDMLTGKDELTQISNQSRLYYLQMLGQWIFGEGHILVGIGPATQSGPGDDLVKLLGDGYWFSMLIEYGLFFGLLIIIHNLAFFGLLIINLKKFGKRHFFVFEVGALAVITVLASIVNSALADLSVKVMLYSVLGMFYYHACQRKTARSQQLEIK